MKPVSLELQAFGPFVEKQYIDFEKLSRDDIFLIKGKTGSGKTTIFDAITFALYGGGSGDSEKGKTGRNNFEEWRCTQAKPDAVTYVSFVFSVKGYKYNFTRKLVPKRIKLSAQYEAGVFDEYGNIIPFFNNPKENDLNRKAAEIMGLTKEQFRQVVLLPQGQFERFLTASSGEKEEILQKIFNAGRWEQYAQNVFDRTKSHKDALDEERMLICHSLEDEKLHTLDELRERINEIHMRKEEAIKAHAAFDGKSRQKALDNDIRLAEQFKPLHDSEKKAAELEKQREEIEKKKISYEEAEKAETFRPVIDAFEKSSKELETRRRDLNKKKGALPEKEDALDKAVQAKRQHDEASPVERLQGLIGEYRSKLPAYASFAELDGKYHDAVEQFSAADKECSDAKKNHELAKNAAAELFGQWEAAEEKTKEYRHRYFAGIYGELAAALTDGEKCPVCGSTHHPEPALKASDSISKQELEAQEKASGDVKKKWDKAEKTRQATENDFNKKSEALKEIEAVRTKAESELNAARQQLIDGIADSAALSKAIKKCEADIKAYSVKGKTLDDKLSEAKTAADDLKSKIASAEEELKNAKSAFDSAENELMSRLKDSGYSDYLTVKARLLPADKRSGMHGDIVSYETSCDENDRSLKTIRTALEGKTEPDSTLFDKRRKEISEEKDSFTKADSAAGAELERLGKKLETLSQKETHYLNEIHQAESDLAFARKLRGDTGIGIQRYVLAIMFGKVIDEANRMLRNVHDGRYRLFRSDEKGSGNKRGLELKVFDSRSPENEKGRSVAMLSGGEKFLVSLALSIGMSTVAQKSGVQIDALFIDEGFGTLDDNSIDDAINILRSVGKGSGTIGIISHVALLDGAINTRLEVIKSGAGSSIKPV